MVQWWHQMTLKLFEPKGWTADSVYDLSRDPPHTRDLQQQGEGRPQGGRRHQDRRSRYTTQDFTKLVPEDFEATAPVPEQRRGKRNTSEQQAGIDDHQRAGAEPRRGARKPVRLNALLKADIKAMLTWKHQRAGPEGPVPQRLQHVPGGHRRPGWLAGPGRS